MNQSLSPISDPRNEGVEVSRRLYRSLMDTTRQLDEIRSHAKTTKDLFTVQAHVLRTKLKETGERLLFSNSSLQRQKVEEILWRKGFYEDVSTAKRLRKDNQWLPEERSLLQVHLRCGVGFFHHILLCLQTEFSISSRCIDFPMTFPDQDFGKSKERPSSKQYEAACDSIHRCLLYLGDLNRYLMDVPPSGKSDMAQRYYYQALSWNPDAGMPHNQLGTLSLGRNHNLDAVYYYMRCLMCSQPFNGAEGNLKRSLERNSHHVPEERAVGAFWRCHCKTPGGGQLTESQDHIQQFVTHFLLLVDLWFFDKQPTTNISDLCRQTLLDFRLCLTFSELPDANGHISFSSNNSLGPRDDFPSYLSKDMVLKIVVVALICLINLRKKGSDQASSLVAFLLAMFCTLVQQVQEHMEETVLNLPLSTVKNIDPNEPVVKLNGTYNAEDISKPQASNESSKENGHYHKGSGDSALNVFAEKANSGKLKKPRKIVRRRQRQCSSSDDSDLSNDEAILSATSDLSDDEDVVLDISSDEEGKETRQSIDQDVVVVEEVNEADESSVSICVMNGQNGFNIKQKLAAKGVVNPVQILEQVVRDDLLPAIKVCADWLRGDIPIVKACGKDSSDLFRRLLELVNTINIDQEKLESEKNNDSTLKHRSILESDCKLPLPEDAQLQKLSILATAHENLDWELIRQNSLTSKEEALLRIKRLVNFSNFLQSVPETGVVYEEKTHEFKLCHRDSSSKSDQLNSPSIDLQRRKEVMHNMGQLWLRAEVQNLETSVKKGTKGAPFSPYLVLDVDALTKYFHMVSQLMATKKFIMVVPSVVLTSLDQLKRESVLARDAIRWLEYQFQKGSRFLRAQLSQEAAHLPLVSYPKQKSREAWSYFQVLECCYYLNLQSNPTCNKDSDTRIVTLLTGSNWESSNGFSPVGVAKAVGIAVEHIESFFAKWKTSSKSHG